MKYQGTKLSDDRIEFRGAFTEEEIEKQHKHAVQHMGKDLKVAGFRAGKIPPAVAEKHIDPSGLADHVLNDALNAGMNEIMNREKIIALGQPEVNITKFVPWTTLEFTATVTVVPPFVLPDLTKLKTRREEPAISDEQVAEVLNNLAENTAEKKAVKRAAKNGDEVEIDFTGFKDGEKFDGGAAEKYVLKLGSNSFIPGFEEGIVGRKSGDEFDITVTFPKNYGAANLAGQDAVFKIKLHEVRETTAAKLDDAFAATVSPEFKKLDELKADIRRELTERSRQDGEQKYRDDLIDEIADKAKVPTPSLLLDEQMKGVENEFRQQLSYRGLNFDDFLKDEKLTEEEWRAKNAQPVAEKRVHAALVMRELAQKFNAVATDAEIDAARDEVVSHYNDDSLKKQFQSDAARRDFANQIITEKIFRELETLLAAK